MLCFGTQSNILWWILSKESLSLNFSVSYYLFFSDWTVSGRRQKIRYRFCDNEQLHISWTDKRLLHQLWNGLTVHQKLLSRWDVGVGWLTSCSTSRHGFFLTQQREHRRVGEEERERDRKSSWPPTATDTFQYPVMLPLETVMLISVRSPVKLSSF